MWFGHQLLPELRKEAEMSELERLCVMLHEQGVDHVRNDFGVTWDYYGSPHAADESMDGTLIVTGLTPEQVMAATLRKSSEKSIYELLKELVDDLDKLGTRLNHPGSEMTLGEYDEKCEKAIGKCAESIAVRTTQLSVGRSCASCPEVDNSDSYISHLQSALKWHDEHVPRPTNPRNTCVVLKGENKPDEVLFIHDEGGEVTHYLPEDAGTCRMKLMENIHTSAYQDMYECDRCGEQVLRETYMGKSEPPKFCPECGRRNEASE